MAHEIQPMRIAFWGQASAGKTTLLARYYEYVNTIDPTIDVIADDAEARKLAEVSKKFAVDKNLRDLNVSTTSAAMDTRIYSLGCCQDRKTDPLFRMEWIDYPGKWWHFVNLKDQDEINKRARYLKSLCAANVIFLLIDAGEWYRNGGRYLRDMLSQYTTQIQQLKQMAEIPLDQKRLDQFVIALSKSDKICHTQKGFTARLFKEELERAAGAELANLWREIGAEATEKRYLLLSICKEDTRGEKIASLESIGLDAIAPLAFMTAAAEVEKRQRRLAQASSDGKTVGTIGKAAGATAAAGAGLLSTHASLVVLGMLINPAVALTAFGLFAIGSTTLIGKWMKGKHDSEGAKVKALEELNHAFLAAEENLRRRSYYWDSRCG